MSDIAILKECFIFFMEHNLPWGTFKSALLEDQKSPAELLVMLQSMVHSPLKNHQLTIETNNQNVFVKQSSRKRINIAQTGKQPKSIQMCSLISKFSINSERHFHEHEKPISINIQPIQDCVQMAILEFRNHTKTISAVYEKSSEIDTPQTPQVQVLFAQPMIIQRQAIAMKGYSVYANRQFIQPGVLDNQFQHKVYF